MSLSTSVALFSTLLAVGTQVRGQATGTYPATPLAEKTFAWEDLVCLFHLGFRDFSNVVFPAIPSGHRHPVDQGFPVRLQQV